MGYSARYHAFSIIAVFVALAIGIVIGAGLGSDFVSGTTESLEDSLKEDVEEARAREDELAAELEREKGFIGEIYPALVGGRLRGDNVGLVAFGDLPDNLANDVESALAPTGASLAKVAVVRIPPDLEELAKTLEGTPLGRLAGSPTDVRELGRRLGKQLAVGAELPGDARQALLERFAGDEVRLDRVVFTRAHGDAEDETVRTTSDQFEQGIVEGIIDASVETVAVERSDDLPSSVEYFDELGVPTVDSVDLTSGKVAMVFALLGADGNFGVKESADQLLPDLLQEVPTTGQREPQPGDEETGAGAKPGQKKKQK